MSWRVATVVDAGFETAAVRSLALRVPEWESHRPGQHVDLRLTAEDGYQAQRSYSIASPPEDPLVRLTIERLDDGEVSPYLVDVLEVGDGLELRGPIGGYFVWERAMGGPLLLVAGGSGIVPLMAMVRHRAANNGGVGVRLLYSSRTAEDIIFRGELEDLAGREDGFELRHTLTRGRPDGWTGYARRVDLEMLREVAWPASEDPIAFACGPTAFVESVARDLVTLGYAPERVRTERFGPTGR